jgi:hypothetical protein
LGPGRDEACLKTLSPCGRINWRRPLFVVVNRLGREPQAAVEASGYDLPPRVMRTRQDASGLRLASEENTNALRFNRKRLKPPACTRKSSKRRQFASRFHSATTSSCAPMNLARLWIPRRLERCFRPLRKRRQDYRPHCCALMVLVIAIGVTAPLILKKDRKLK